ncbi:hypothetical protein Tco_0930288 [Tanacetum coccineum]
MDIMSYRAPVQSAAGQDELIDLLRWVEYVVREEWTTYVFGLELIKYRNVKKEMVQMLHIAMTCVGKRLETRPKMDQVIRMLEEIRMFACLAHDELNPRELEHLLGMAKVNLQVEKSNTNRISPAMRKQQRQSEREVEIAKKNLLKLGPKNDAEANDLLQAANQPLETYMKQNGLTSSISEQQASSGSQALAQGSSGCTPTVHEDEPQGTDNHDNSS